MFATEKTDSCMACDLVVKINERLVLWKAKKKKKKKQDRGGPQHSQSNELLVVPSRSFSWPAGAATAAQGCPWFQSQIPNPAPSPHEDRVRMHVEIWLLLYISPLARKAIVQMSNDSHQLDTMPLPHDTTAQTKDQAPDILASGMSPSNNDQALVHRSLAAEILFVGVVCAAQLLTQAGLALSIAPQASIAQSFHITDPGTFSWFSAAYSLTVGTFILPAGRLGDVFGHKRFLAGRLCLVRRMVRARGLRRLQRADPVCVLPRDAGRGPGFDVAKRGGDSRPRV